LFVASSAPLLSLTMGDLSKCCGVFVFILLIISVSLFGASFKTLGPLEAGLKINTVTQSISTSPIYTSGRYFLGLTNSFLTYPTTLQSIEFSDTTPGAAAGSLSASTKEGQSIVLELSFQYRLRVGSLGALYRKYLQNYASRYVSVAESLLKNQAVLFSSTDYFERRREIAEVMHSALNTELYTNHYAAVEHFQLRQFSFKPQASGAASTADSSILTKLIKEQSVQTASINQNSTLVRASTSVITSQATQQVVVINAQAASQSKIIVQEANARGISISLNATAQAYRLLKERLGYSSPELLYHLFLENVRALSAPSKLVIDIDNALLSF